MTGRAWHTNSSSGQIIIAHPDPTVRPRIVGWLRAYGFQAHCCYDLEGFSWHLRERPKMVIISGFDSFDGLSMLKRLKALEMKCHVIFLAAESSVEVAVAASSIGAPDMMFLSVVRSFGADGCRD